MASAQRRGILLAGGNGTRFAPLTSAVSKQLMPVYVKPMVYHPLTTLMLAGIREVLMITTPTGQSDFQRLLGDGSAWGMEIQYAVHPRPDGLAQAFLIGSDVLAERPAAMVLGDNLFHGRDLMPQLKARNGPGAGATVLAYPVSDAQRYGVVEFDAAGRVPGIKEKPEHPRSRHAVTGRYFYDDSVVEMARRVRPSRRGELEITDLNQLHLRAGLLRVDLMGRGMAWLDTGTPDSLEAASHIRTLEHRQGLKVGCPEQVAWRMGWVESEQLERQAQPLRTSGYGNHLLDLIKENTSAHSALQTSLLPCHEGRTRRDRGATAAHPRMFNDRRCSLSRAGINLDSRKPWKWRPDSPPILPGQPLPLRLGGPAGAALPTATRAPGQSADALRGRAVLRRGGGPAAHLPHLRPMVQDRAERHQPSAALGTGGIRAWLSHSERNGRCALQEQRLMEQELRALTPVELTPGGIEWPRGGLGDTDSLLTPKHAEAPPLPEPLPAEELVA
jgi:glucose-1-phosphate thymidylyltransferase